MGKILSPQGSGYFTYCIQESSDSRNAIWSLENAMKIYWRVRSWSFSANAIRRTYDQPDPEQYTDTPFTTNLDNIVSKQFIGPDAVLTVNTKEEELVCGAFFTEGLDELVDIWGVIEFGTVKKVGDQYNAGLSGYVIDLLNAAEYSFRTPTPYAVQATSTISFCGGTLPIGVRSIAEGGEFPESIISLGPASLTPTSYWSYGGTYDTTTGEPL
jgi:hypothetical protein